MRNQRGMMIRKLPPLLIVVFAAAVFLFAAILLAAHIPTVEITDPVSGQVVSGVVPVSVNYGVDHGNVHTLILLAGSPPAEVERIAVHDQEGSHTFFLDTINYPDGPLQIKVEACSSSPQGDHCSDDLVSVVADNIEDDTEAPEIEIASPDAGELVSASPVVVSAALSDNVAVSPESVVVKLDTQTVTAQCDVTAVSVTCALSPSDGQHNVTIDCQDTSGNPADQAAASFTLDTISPDVSVTSHTDGQTVVSPTIDLAGTASDATSGVSSVEINSEAAVLNGNAWGYENYALDEGANVITATVEDAAGHSTIVTITINYNPPDTQKPVITIEEPVNGAIIDAVPVLVSAELEDNEAVATATVVVKLDGENITGDCAVTSFSVSCAPSPEDGAHTIIINCKDINNNAAVQKSAAFTVDTVAPVVAVTSHSDGQTVVTPTINLAGMTSDATSGVVSVKANGEDASLDGGSWSLAGFSLEEGPNAIVVEAEDAAGHTTLVTITINYVVPECFNDAGCDDGNAYTQDVCSAPGSADAACSHTDIECLGVADCNDSDAYTADDCTAAGTIRSACVHSPIACLSNADCNDGQQLTIDTCNSPGTAGSSCSHDPLECASDSDCEDENALTIDDCLNPGTIQSECSHVVIACNTNDDCSDGNNYTEDVCAGGGTPGASCNHNIIECLSAADCDDGQALTLDACSGAGTPRSACVNTPIACNTDPDCDDGNDHTRDACSGGGTLQASCSHDQISCLSDSECDDGNDHTIDACLNAGAVTSSCAHQPVECLSDSECGDSDDHTLDSCQNAGTASAACSHQEIACLNNSECDDGNPLTIDVCDNPGLVTSACINTPIACNAAADCDDSDPYTQDLCEGGGTLSAACVHIPIRCLGTSDCDDGAPLTIDACSDAGTPQSACSNVPIACLSNADCDDLDARTFDTCINGGAINAECEHQSIECLNNGECDDSDSLTIDACVNPGLPASACTHTEIECAADADCDDGDSHTFDSCLNGGTVNASCSRQSIECLNDAECDDGAPLTLDSCGAPGTPQSSCVHDPLQCADAADCDDGNALTLDSCDAPGTTESKCVHTAIACNTAADCDDLNAYTLDECAGGGTSGAACVHAAIRCLTDADCADSNGFTIDVCSAPGTADAACSNTGIPCNTDSDCEDGNAYTINRCENGRTLQAACSQTAVACLSDSDCPDGNPLTVDGCVNPGSPESSCTHTPIACNTGTDCADENALTLDSCENAGAITSECVHTAITCNTDADCDDENAYTLDSCAGGGTTAASCAHTAIRCLTNVDCDDSDPLTTDSCVNPGAVSSSCSNVKCPVACASAADCDDENPLTNDVCSNPGACAATCSHVACSVACSSNAACDDGNHLTTDTCANPGTCSSSCSHIACTVVCISDAECDDGNTATTDACASPGTCGATCSHIPVSEPPALTLAITAPADGLITNNPTITITGTTTSGAIVTLNGSPAAVGADGAFSDGVAINEGINTINIIASLGAQSIKKTITVTLDTKAPTVISSDPADGAEIETAPTRVAVRVEDNPGGSGLNTTGIRLFLDGEEITGQYVATTQSIEAAGIDIQSGSHILQVSASDLAGNTLDQTVAFVLAGKGPKVKFLKLPGTPGASSVTGTSSADTGVSSFMGSSSVQSISTTPATEGGSAATAFPTATGGTTGAVTTQSASSGWLDIGQKYDIDTILELLKDKYPSNDWNHDEWSSLTGAGGGLRDAENAASPIADAKITVSSYPPEAPAFSVEGELEAQIEEGDAPVDADSIHVEVDGNVLSHEYDPASKKVKSKVIGLRKGAHNTKVTASDTDGATGMAMSAFTVSALADTLTFENLTTPGTEIRAGDRFRLRVNSSYQYTPWVVLYNPDVEPVTPGAVGPCNVRYLVGDGYSPALIGGTTYSYEGEGIFYTSADREGRAASRVYAATPVDAFDEFGNGNCLFSSNSMTVIDGPVAPHLDSATFKKATDPAAKVISLGDEYTITASGSPGVVNADYWLIDPEQIVGGDIFGAAVDSGVLAETSLGPGQYTLASPRTLNNVTPPGKSPARFLLALVKPRAWNADIPPAVSDILYVGPAPAPVFNVVEVSNADHPGEPLRHGQRYRIHVQGDVDYAHQSHLNVVLVNSDRFYPGWKPYYGTGLFIPGTESRYNTGLNWMDPNIYGPGVYEAEGFMPPLSDSEGQAVANIRAIVTAASYFDHAVSSPVPAEQAQPPVSVENIRFINKDHPDWTTVAASETVRVEVEADPGLNLECLVSAAGFSGGENTEPVVWKAMTEGPSGKYSCEGAVATRPDVNGAPADFLMAKIISSGNFVDMADDLLTYRDAIREVHFRNLTRTGATDIAPGERFEITAAGQSGLSDIYGSILDAALFHSAQQGPFQPTDRLIEDTPGNYRIEAALATVPAGVTKIRAAIGDPNSPVKPVVSTEILAVVHAEPPKPPEITHVNNVLVSGGEVTSDSLSPVVAGTATPDSTVNIFEFIEGGGVEVAPIAGGASLSAGYIPSPGVFGDDFNNGDYTDRWRANTHYGDMTVTENPTTGKLEMDLAPNSGGNIESLSTVPVSGDVTLAIDVSFPSSRNPDISGGMTDLGMNLEMESDWNSYELVWGMYGGDTSSIWINERGQGPGYYATYPMPVPDTVYTLKLQYNSVSHVMDAYINDQLITSRENASVGGSLRPVLLANSGDQGLFIEWDNLTTNVPVPSGYEISGPALTLNGTAYDGFQTGSGLFLSPCTEMQPQQMPVRDYCVTGEKDIYAFLITASNVQVEDMVVPELKVTFYTAGDPNVEHDDHLEFIKQFFDAIKGRFIGDYAIDTYGPVLAAPAGGAPGSYEPVSDIQFQQMLCRYEPGEPGSLRWDAAQGKYLASKTPLAKDGVIYDDFVIWGPAESGDGPNPVYTGGTPIWWADGSEDVGISLMNIPGMGLATGYGIEAFFDTAPPEINFIATATHVLQKPGDPNHLTPDPQDDHYTWNQPALNARNITVAPVESCSGGMFKLIGETVADDSGSFATQVVSFDAPGDHIIAARSTKNDFTTKWSDPVIYHLQTGGPTDTTAPEIAFVSYSDGDCANNTQPVIGITITDAEAGTDWPGVKCSTSVGVSCSVAQTGTPGGAEITFGSALPESVVTITVEADDLADPKNHASKSLSLHIDITPPLPFATAPVAWPEPGVEGEYDDDTEIFLTYTETADNPGGCGIAAYYASVAADPAECINATGAVTIPGQHTTVGFEGLNYYCVAAADRAGNRVAAHDTIIIDLTDPEITNISSSPDPFSPTNPTSVGTKDTTKITATIADANPDAWKVEIVETSSQIGWGTGADVSVTWDGGGLSDGPHTYRVSAIDLAGNYSEATGAVTIDNTSPTVSITNPANNEKINPALYTLKASASDASGVASVEFLLNGTSIGMASESAPGVYSLTYDFTALKNKWRTLTARATDNAGNTTDNTIQFFVQNKPIVVNSVEMTNLTRSGATDISIGEMFLVTVTLSAKDDSLAVNIGNTDRLSPWPQDPTANPFLSFSTVQTKWQGAKYTLKGVLLSATDGDSQTATTVSAAVSLDNYTSIKTSTSLSIIRDTTPPLPPVITKPKNNTSSPDPTPDISGTAEPLSNITVYLKGSPDKPVAYTETGANGVFTTTSDSLSPAGKKQLFAVATDAAGNTSDPSAIVNYTLKDTTKPVIKDVADAPDPFSPHVSIGSKDTTTITADVYDETPRSWLLRIFNSNNELVLKYPENFDLPTNPIGPNPLSFIWDGNKPRKNKPPLPQPEDTYRYEIQAVDYTGRKSDWATGAVTIDKTAPSAQITAPASGTEIFEAERKIELTASDNIAVDYIVVSVDGDEIGRATAPVAAGQYEYLLLIPPLGPGVHTIGAVAWDTAGNWSATSSISIHVDAEPPTLTIATASEKIISPAASAGVKDSVIFSGTATDRNLVRWAVEILNASGTVEFTHEEPFISPQPYIPATFTYSWNGKNTAGTAFLPDGEYTWSIKAFDAVGNSAATTGTITIDNTPPGVTITSPANGEIVGGVAREVLIGTSDSNEIVSVSLFVYGAPDSQAVRTATSTWQATIYPHIYGDGPRTIGVVATDIAGNPSATATVNIIIDTVAPNPPINLTATENPDGTVTLSWEPPVTNEDGSPLTDLAGYNIYMVTEQNRCEPINPVSGDTTLLVCDSGSNPGTYTINGPALSFGGIDYNQTPLGTSALWLDLSDPDNPIMPLPLTDSAAIDPSKPVFAFLLQLHLTARSGEVPGEYHVTAYTQNSWAEIEQFLDRAAEFGALTPDSRIIVHTTVCANSNLGGFIPMPLPFTSIPNYNFEKLNPVPIIGSVYQFPDTGSGDAMFTAQAVDLASNSSIFSNISQFLTWR